jgi:hypothetical protein
MQELGETVQSSSEGSHMRLRSASVLGGTLPCGMRLDLPCD